MNTNELMKAEELYFIDLETVGGSGICQIGITKWSKKEQRLSIVFNEIINPDVPREQINPHALRVHRISEYQWSKAQPYSKFHDQIKKILDGKIVLQWGGSDIGIIYKNIRRYNLSEIKTTSLNSWSYQFKGTKLSEASRELEFTYESLHSAALDSYLTALLFVSKIFGYEVTNVDKKIIDSFNSRSPKNMERFKTNQLKENGTGDEVCLTGFTNQEKLKFGEILSQKGFKVRSSVTSGLRILITPSGTYKRSPGKEAEALKVGAKVMDLNNLMKSLEGAR